MSVRVVTDAPLTTFDDRIRAFLKEMSAPGTVCLFKVGDYWEAYGDDAQIVASKLGLVVARSRDKSMDMTGFPYHVFDRSINALVNAGFRVVVAEQV